MRKGEIDAWHTRVHRQPDERVHRLGHHEPSTPSKPPPARDHRRLLTITVSGGIVGNPLPLLPALPKMPRQRAGQFRLTPGRI